MFRTSRRFVAFTLLAAAFFASMGAQSGPLSNAINAYRNENGLKTLATHAALETAAQKYAQFLANRDQTTASDWHNLDGRSPGARASAEGYSAGVWENVQLNWGHANPAGEAMRWWKNSPGHNANMLNAGHTVMGVGAAKSASGKWFFVAMFGQTPSRTPPPGGSATTPTPRPTPKIPSDTTTVKKLTVQIENKTPDAMTFNIEGKSYTLAAGHTGTYWYSKAGPVQLGWSRTAPDGMGLSAGGSELQDRARYAFVVNGSGRAFVKTGSF